VQEVRGVSEGALKPLRKKKKLKKKLTSKKKNKQKNNGEVGIDRREAKKVWRGAVAK